MSNYRNNPNYCRNNHYQNIPERTYGYSHTNSIEEFPIAMAYVPWQKWEQPYEPEVGLNKGTIFPDLFKPFLGAGGCR